MTITLLAPDGVAVTAQQERQARAAQHGGGAGRQLGGRSGFRVGTPSTILSATSTTWTLGACSAMLDPGAQTHQGMYGWSSDANITGIVTAADSTNPRKDIVYIQVNDSDVDSSGAKSAPVLYLAGTPGSTPAAPTLPARSFLVGTISVPIAGGGSPTVALNPARYVAAGAPLPVDLTERDALAAYDGLTVQRRDVSGRPLETYDATAASWTRTVSTPDSGWVVPAVFGNGFTPYVGSGYDGVKYRLINGFVHVSGAAINAGSWASGVAVCALPAGYIPSRKIVGTNCVVDTNGNVLTTTSGTNTTTTFAAMYPMG